MIYRYFNFRVLYVVIHQSPTLTKVKKEKVGIYYKSDELI